MYELNFSGYTNGYKEEMSSREKSTSFQVDIKMRERERQGEILREGG